MSSRFPEKLKQDFRDLQNLLSTNKNAKKTFNNWIRRGFPQLQTGGRDGVLFSFFKDKFGFHYGDNEKFKDFRKDFDKFQQQEGLKLDLSKVEEKHKQSAAPAPELEITNDLDKIFEKNEKGHFKYPKLIKKVLKWYKKKDEKLTELQKDYINQNLLKFIDAIYEIKNNNITSNATQKTEPLNKKIQELNYVINFPKNELQRKKAMKMKKDIEKQIKKIYLKEIYENYTEGQQKLKYIEPQKESYISNKNIPLYVKNKDGPGYHRITSEEIIAFKNDPSGDYYDGTGRNKTINYNDFEHSGYKLGKDGKFRPY